MKKRGERSVRELYERTDDIARSEVKPLVAEISPSRGPVDELDHAVRRMTDARFATSKRNILGDSTHIKVESGTCNVCSAPCSSCLHRTLSHMEHGSSGNACGRAETDSYSFIGADGQPPFKGREYDDQQFASSETSNQLSVTLSHASYSENAESKATLNPRIRGGSSETVDMSSKAPLPLVGPVAKDHRLSRKIFDYNFVSSSSRSKYDLHCMRNLKQEKSQHGEECHGDNISCISGISVSHDPSACMIKKVQPPKFSSTGDLQKEKVSQENVAPSTCMIKKAQPRNFASTGDLQKEKVSQENVARGSKVKQISLRNLDTCTQECLRKKTSDASDWYIGLSDNSIPAEFPLCETKGLLRAKSSNLNSHNGSFQKNSAEDLQTNPACKPCGDYTGSELLIDSVTCSPKGQLACVSVDGDNATEIRNESSPRDLKNVVSCSEEDAQVITNINCEGVKCNCSDKRCEKQHYLHKVNDESELQIQAKMVSNGGNFESDGVLVDVKVCDICGDAGREELLATCSRCSDGAEHIYCMCVMLHKVPEGEWLCEECLLKETSEKNRSTPQTSDTQRVVVTRENNWNSRGTFNHKKLHGTGADPEMGRSTERLHSTRKSREKCEIVHEIDTAPSEMIEGLQSPKKTGENRVGGILSPFKKRVSESGTGALEMASPRQYGVFSWESSFKDSSTGNVKSAGNASARGAQAIKCSQNLSRSCSFGSMPKIQVQLASPRASNLMGLSKQHSLDSSNMKPKQLTEIAPEKYTAVRHPAFRNARHDDAMGKFSKSASFRSTDLSHSNVFLGKQKKFCQSEEHRILKPIKDKRVLEKKSSLTVELASHRLSPKVDISFKKLVSKTAQNDENLFNKSGSSILTTNKASACGGEKKPKLQKSKSHERCSSKGQNTCEIVPKNDGHATVNEIVKPSRESNAFSLSLLPRLVEFSLKGNEVKEAVNSSKSRQVICGGNKSLDSQKSNTNKPSDSQSLKESCGRRKWKNAGEAAMSRTKTQQSNGIPGKSEQLSMLRGVVSGETVSEDSAPTPDCQEKIPEQKDMMRSSCGVACKSEATMGVQYDKQPKDFNLNATLTGSDEPGAQPVAQTFHSQSSLLGNPFRSLAIPEHEFIWQGGFVVSGAGKPPQLFEGIQAHLSTRVSPKVPEVVAQFPCRIQLEESPRLNSWPLQFLEKIPSEDNIALFFFAKDIESYERTYRKLLENMLKNDLALKGALFGVELLIFPSDKLSENCQCWNNLLFLWGIFRARTSQCSRELPDCVPTLSTNSDAQGSSEEIVHTVTERGLSRSDGSPKLKAREPNIFLDSKSFLPPMYEGYMSIADEFPSESVSLAGAETGISKLASCFLSESMHQPELQMSVKELQPPFHSHAADLNNGNGTEGCGAFVPPTVYPHTISTLDCLSTISTSPNVKEDGVGRPRVAGLAEKDTNIKSEPPFYSESEEPVNVRDHLCSDSNPTRKRLLQVSNDTSRSNITTNFVQLDDESECKKRKYLSSKIHPLLVGNITQRHNVGDLNSKVGIEESLRSPERNLAPEDPGRVVYVLPSDEGGLPESSTLDLELALGNKPSKTANRVGMQDKLTTNSADGEVDLSPSLSLSLGFPGTEMDSNLKTTQVLPERPDINTSLSLFGGFSSSWVHHGYCTVLSQQ